MRKGALASPGARLFLVVIEPAYPGLFNIDFSKGDYHVRIMTRQSAGLLFLLLFIIGLVLSAGGGAASAADPVYSAYMPVVVTPSRILFRDDFSDPNSGWWVDDLGYVALSYENGAYNISMREKDVWALSQAPAGGFTDYSVQAEVSYSSSLEDGYAGLVFDLVDFDNYYFYVVNSNSQWFGLAKLEDGVPSLVVPPTPSTEINSGLGMNLLKVKRVGEQIDLFINNEVVATVDDEGFGEKVSAGLYMRSNSDREVSTAFDNFMVWLPVDVPLTSNGFAANVVEPAAVDSGLSGVDIFD